MKDIQTFKNYVADAIHRYYRIDEDTAKQIVEESYVSKMLEIDPDFCMHDSIEYCADYIMELYNNENQT